MRSKKTFILSFWVEEGEAEILRGMLQNVKSGEKQTFATVDELLALIRDRLQRIDVAPQESEIVEVHGE